MNQPVALFSVDDAKLASRVMEDFRLAGNLAEAANHARQALRLLGTERDNNLPADLRDWYRVEFQFAIARYLLVETREPASAADCLFDALNALRAQSGHQEPRWRILRARCNYLYALARLAAPRSPSDYIEGIAALQTARESFTALEDENLYEGAAEGRVRATLLGYLADVRALERGEIAGPLSYDLHAELTMLGMSNTLLDRRYLAIVSAYIRNRYYTLIEADKRKKDHGRRDLEQEFMSIRFLFRSKYWPLTRLAYSLWKEQPDLTDPRLWNTRLHYFA